MMINNYFKIAFRSLLKNKTFSFINIIGLTIGTLCCLYILLYVEDQYSFDKHHKDVNDIYRITTSLSLRGDKHNNATSSPPIAPAMKREFPEVVQFTRVIGDFGQTLHLLKYKEKMLYEHDAVFVDSTFFDVFSYHFVNGDKKTVLLEPFSIVLLKSISDKLFDGADPVGKIIEINDNNGKNDYKVTGVVDESLGKSHIRANIFIAMNSGGIGQYVRESNAWAGNNFANSYIKLNPYADAVALERKLPAFLLKYGAQQLKDLGMEKKLHLQRVSAIHTTTGYEVEMTIPASQTFLKILLLIAIIIQGIACINFMNLSTARAARRAKEVGVRKVAGAERKHLIRQFLSESFLLSLLAVLIALPLLFLVLPYFNQVTQARIQFSLFSDYRIWLMLGVIIVSTGLIAGSYPAFYLSAFQVTKVMKGNFTSHISAVGIRQFLVVFQFTLSIVLIAAILIIYRQLDYVTNKDLGFDKNQRLIFSFHTDDTRNKMSAFADDLRQLAEVKMVSAASNYLSQFVPRDHGVFLAGGNMAVAIDAQNMVTDEFFRKANGIQLVRGRDFYLNDSGKVIINETLMKRLGLNLENAIGTRLYSQYEPDPVSFVEVAGVMKDFNYNSLHNEVRPFMLVYNPKDRSLLHLTVFTDSKDYKSILIKMASIWQKDFPGVPFEYSFLDEEVQRQYESEITLSRIINLFTLMAIFISCLGLFGLAAFSAEQRRKEIGIRKVLGASIPGIVQLLSRDFVKLILISICIASPVAWYVMNRWLQEFAYRINISWWVFFVSGVLAVLIALPTICFQAIKAAIANPVKSIRTE